MHTPGPWEADVALDGAFSIYAKGPQFGGGQAILCSRAPWKHLAEESEANARLIAAAPDLVSALTALSHEMAGTLTAFQMAMREAVGNTNYNILVDRVDRANAALSKAGSE